MRRRARSSHRKFMSKVTLFRFTVNIANSSTALKSLISFSMDHPHLLCVCPPPCISLSPSPPFPPLLLPLLPVPSVHHFQLFLFKAPHKEGKRAAENERQEKIIPRNYTNEVIQNHMKFANCCLRSWHWWWWWW